jgi:hypothetical protein
VWVFSRDEQARINRIVLPQSNESLKNPWPKKTTTIRINSNNPLVVKPKPSNDAEPKLLCEYLSELTPFENFTQLPGWMNWLTGQRQQGFHR